ncbi:MAG: phosphate regulon sensor histidine kinase PhoR [Proteobacteria bacterium]|nr:phosphate regulon sensor histidine kinase PhoR [Pseudomonadota bacterium]
MTPIVRRSLAWPAVVAALTLATLAGAGSAAALAVGGVGAVAVVAYHLWHLWRIAAWAAGPPDARVPDGYGVWGPLLTLIHRRVRARNVYEQDLRNVIARFEAAASAMPDGVVVLDAADRIEVANPRAQALLGLDAAHDRGQPIVNLVRQPGFLAYLEAGDFGDVALVPSGREPARMLALQLVPFAAGRKLLMARDVTEREAVARMRREFIANVSHELKTPLTVIAGFIETLQDLELDPAQRARFLGLMREQAHNMQRLVADLLTLSALESEDHPLVDEEVDVAALLRAAADEAKLLSRGQHAVDVDAGPAAIVHGSHDELASAYGNLVSNAIRYTPSGGRVALSWRIGPDGTGVLAVADTGIGIAAEYLPRLAERFYRVDRSRSRATGGTGLGLAIVKHVALRHGGELAIESERGRGSTFAIRLPASRVVPAASVTSSAAPRGTAA